MDTSDSLDCVLTGALLFLQLFSVRSCVNADHCLLGRSILTANFTGVKAKSSEADYVKGM